MATFDKLLDAIKLLEKEIGGGINLEQTLMLIEMMAHYPKNLSFDEAAEFVGTHLGMIRENSKVLGKHLVQNPNSKEWNDIGLGLVEVKTDPYEPEKEIFILTKKGMVLKAMLVDALS